MLYVLNYLTAKIFLVNHTYFTVFSLLCGILVSFIAHLMRFDNFKAATTKEADYVPHYNANLVKLNTEKEDNSEETEKNSFREEFIDAENQEKTETVFQKEEQKIESRVKENNDLPKLKPLMKKNSDMVVHLEDCIDISSLEEEQKTVIGSKKYALANNLAPCSKCQPFG